MAEQTKKRRSSTRHPQRLGAEIVQRLKRFTENLDATDDLTRRFTCRTVRLNIGPTKYTAAQVKSARHKLCASQAIFAQFLGVSPSAVQDWEQGVKTPRGSACRLMDEIRRDPEYYLRRLRELSLAVVE